MVETQDEQEHSIRSLLVVAPAKDKNAAPPHELKGLVTTLGLEVAGIIVLTRLEPTPAYGMGSGKAQEISDAAKERAADCIIFDWIIDPTKQRNWEKLAGMPVLDRNEVILRIFGQRARTKEAVLQVELAQLTYALPRLSHIYGSMARQRGGAFGSRGSGETQLELDRRQIEDKIDHIKRELLQVEITRQTQRKQRERTASPRCALVGYTNAGKSSLLNALTGADAFVEDKLFATLDPTTRRLALSEASSVLITDTVGFISNLPHTLVDAFRSTLEEAAHTDLLLIVVDAEDANNVQQYGQVQKVLAEIHADEIASVIILNKIDRVQDNPARLSELDVQFPGALAVSAHTHQGFEQLQAILIERLLGTQADYRIPLDHADLVELVRKNGTIEYEEWLDDAIHLTARVPGTITLEGTATTRTLALLAPYKAE